MKKYSEARETFGFKNKPKVKNKKFIANVLFWLHENLRSSSMEILKQSVTKQYCRQKKLQ